MPTPADDAGFLSRWSRRKAQARQGTPVDEADLPVVAAAVAVPAVPAGPARPDETSAGDAVVPQRRAAEAPPLPTLADVAALTHDSDYTRFVAQGVQPEVRNAALAKLFTDPHFNVMDGLDTYIDDYGKPDPLPAGMLRQLVQSRMLGLFDDEPKAEAAAPAEATCSAPAAAVDNPTPPPGLPDHEDPAVQLQPDDGAGCSVPESGPGEDAGRQP